MIIRKKFKFEGAHIVRGCAISKRCATAIHGHSFIVEVFLTANTLDKAGMVMDFGLLKGTVAEFIDSFDHSYFIWDKESIEVKNNLKGISERWIELPLTPSAECLALIFLYVIDKIIKNTHFCNDEGQIIVNSVRIHETDTGYAEAFIEDLRSLSNGILANIIYSDDIINEWKNKNWWRQLCNGEEFINPQPLALPWSN